MCAQTMPLKRLQSAAKTPSQRRQLTLLMAMLGLTAVNILLARRARPRLILPPDVPASAVARLRDEALAEGDAAEFRYGIAKGKR